MLLEDDTNNINFIVQTEFTGTTSKSKKKNINESKVNKFFDLHKIDCLNPYKILSLSTIQRFLNQSLKKSQKIQGRVLIHQEILHRRHLILFFSPIQ